MPHFKDIKTISKIKGLPELSNSILQIIVNLLTISNLLFNALPKDKCNEQYSQLHKFISLVFSVLVCDRVCKLSVLGQNTTIDGKKDIWFRFLNNPAMDWRNLLRVVVMGLVKLSDKKAKKDGLKAKFTALIVDDTTLQKAGRRIEGVGMVHDHLTGRFVNGFKLLVCAYFDGFTTKMMDYSLFGEKGNNKEGRVQGMTQAQLARRFKRKRSKNCPVAIEKADLLGNKNDMVREMVKQAISTAVVFKYVLFDSWFMNGKMANFISGCGKKFLAMAKYNGTEKYVVGGKEVKLKELVAQTPRRKVMKLAGTCYRYFEVDATLAGLPVKLFFSKLGRNAKWSALVTNDLEINYKEMLELYKVRWTIEVAFKELKQKYGLGKYQGTDFGGQLGAVAVSIIIHAIFSHLESIDFFNSKSTLFNLARRERGIYTLADEITELIESIIEIISEHFDLDFELVFKKIVRSCGIAKEVFAFKNAVSVT